MPALTADTIILISACIVVLVFVVIALAFAENGGAVIAALFRKQDRP